MKILLLSLLVSSSAFARPSVYTDLVDHVIQAPNQGQTETCLYQASTGAMEILLNQRHGYRYQMPGGAFDLGEQFLIFQPYYANNRGDKVVAEFHKFNFNKAIHANNLPFFAYQSDGSVNRGVWSKPPFYASLPRMEVPDVESIKLFERGSDEWATRVLDNYDIEDIKQALWERQAPILVRVNDNRYWHVVIIVGYDDRIQTAVCHDNTPASECSRNQEGAFYVRDSYGGPATQLRDTDWLRIKGNAAYQVMLRD